VQLTTDNRIENLTLITDPERRAVFNDTHVEHMGRLVLRKLRFTGAVQPLVRYKVRGGHVEAEDIDILAADVRGYRERPVPRCAAHARNRAMSGGFAGLLRVSAR
jgi:hypothetical protein